MTNHHHLIELLGEQQQEISGLSNGVRLTLYLVALTEFLEISALGVILYLLM